MLNRHLLYAKNSYADLQLIEIVKFQMSFKKL